jgi:hypothetical protein
LSSIPRALALVTSLSASNSVCHSAFLLKKISKSSLLECSYFSVVSGFEEAINHVVSDTSINKIHSPQNHHQIPKPHHHPGYPEPEAISAGTKADRWLVDRLVIRDSFVVSIDRSLPPNRENYKAIVTYSFIMDFLSI